MQGSSRNSLTKANNVIGILFQHFCCVAIYRITVSEQSGRMLILEVFSVIFVHILFVIFTENCRILKFEIRKQIRLQK